MLFNIFDTFDSSSFNMISFDEKFPVVFIISMRKEQKKCMITTCFAYIKISMKTELTIPISYVCVKIRSLLI